MGHRQSEKRPAEEGVLEDVNGPAMSVYARDLDGVLHCFGAAVEEGCLGVTIDCRAVARQLRQFDERGVGYRGKIGMQVAVDLILQGADDAIISLADGKTSPSSGEADESVLSWVFDQ